MPSRAVVWFHRDLRRDLRVADHPALLAALDDADQVVPGFVVDRTLLEGRPSGPNRRAFLHEALQALARDLEALGGRLLVLEGDPPTPGSDPGPGRAGSGGSGPRGGCGQPTHPVPAIGYAPPPGPAAGSPGSRPAGVRCGVAGAGNHLRPASRGGRRRLGRG
jgi:hypothetical protein